MFPPSLQHTQPLKPFTHCLVNLSASNPRIPELTGNHADPQAAYIQHRDRGIDSDSKFSSYPASYVAFKEKHVQSYWGRGLLSSLCVPLVKALPL